MLLLILNSSCEKEDYTLPVNFTLNFTISNEPILGGLLTIDEIGLGLKSIDIRGYREQGDDVFLTRSFEQGKHFVINPAATNVSEKLDVPQGVYNPLLFSTIFQPDDEEGDLIDDIYDWLEDLEEDNGLESLQKDLGEIVEDYLEEINPCIMLKGRFTLNQKTKYVLMVVNDPLTFQITAKNRTEGAEVILDKNIVNTGNLQFSPAYWFSAISPEILNNAFVGITDDVEYIFLSKYVNSLIYTAVFNRMEESTTLAINE